MKRKLNAITISFVLAISIFINGVYASIDPFQSDYRIEDESFDDYYSVEDQSDSQLFFDESTPDEAVTDQNQQCSEGEVEETTGVDETSEMILESETEYLTNDQIRTIKWVWTQRNLDVNIGSDDAMPSELENVELLEEPDADPVSASYDETIDEWVFIISGNLKEMNNDDLVDYLPDKVIITKNNNVRNDKSIGENEVGVNDVVIEEKGNQEGDQVVNYRDNEDNTTTEAGENEELETEEIENENSLILESILPEDSLEIEKTIMAWSMVESLSSDSEKTTEENRYKCILEDGNSFEVIVKIKDSYTDLSVLEVDAPELVGASNSCGDKITWKKAGSTLSITGTGDMYDYNYDGTINTPWYGSRNEFTDIVISDGVTSIGDAAFCSFSNLKNVEIPDSVTRIGKCAFSECTSLESITIPDGVSVIEYRTFYMCTSLSSMNTVTDTDGKVDISGCAVTLSKTSYTYSGSARKPTVTVKYGDTELVKGIDYTVTFADNTGVGTATVTVTGKGDNYYGAVKKTFTIKQAAPKLTFASETVSKTTLDSTFTNTLTKTTDGIVTFKSSNTAVAIVNTSGLVTIKGEGTTTITATAAAGKNYKMGSNNYVLTVVRGGTDISGGAVTLSSTSYTYNGNTKKPTVTLKIGDIVLVKGTDYTVVYKDNTNAGTAMVTITGEGNYYGTVTKTFTIKQAAPKLAFASATVSKTTLDTTFTNTLTKTTDGTVKYKSSNTAVATVNATNGLVTIKGEGMTTITATAATGENYKSGSASYVLTVDKGETDISNGTVTLSATSYTYNGSARKPTVTLKIGDVTLVSGVDYTVSYKDNTNAGTAIATATGKGSYIGSVSKTFKIKKATPVLAFIDNIISKTMLDGTFANGFTKTTDGKVTFASNNTDVAIVNKTSGLVTLKGIGTATISASAEEGNNYKAGTASYVLTVEGVSIRNASVAGVSLSYGYSGKAYTPVLTVKVNGVTLIKDTDYTVEYKNNKNPGTATITITGIGKYCDTRIKKFEIVDCVSALVSGKTYQLIPKNNSVTAVSAYSGKMVNNTKVYITDRTNSEAMRFKVVKNSNGTWKFINAKCELALAVQSNSSEVGAGLVLYDQSSKAAQNWKLSKKSDNSFAIINAVTDYSIAMSDASAVKGTTLSMAETASSGLQRFYIAETEEVDASFDGTYAVKTSANSAFVLNIESSSKEDGANVNLYTNSSTNSKRFKAMYSGGGYYRFVNMNSGLVLTVQGNTKKDGTNVIQSRWAAQSGQRWKIEENTDGTVVLTNALGTVLYLTEGKAANGTNVVAKAPSASNAQKWILE